MIEEKYYMLLEDANLDMTNDTYSLYKKYHLALIDDYSLCLRLIKKKDYVKEINRLKKKFNMYQNGIMDNSLINRLNLDFKLNVYNKTNKEDGEKA